MAPIIDKYIKIEELAPQNGIRRFEVKNDAKGNSRIVDLRISKIPGFPKSNKSADVQVLFQYFKEEIREVHKDLIDKIKSKKNTGINFSEFTNEENYVMKDLIKSVALNYDGIIKKVMDMKNILIKIRKVFMN